MALYMRGVGGSSASMSPLGDRSRVLALSSERSWAGCALSRAASDDA